MSATVTPERVKTVLTSFLVKTNSSTTSILEGLSNADDTQDKDRITLNEENTQKSNTVALRSHKSFLKRLDTFTARTWFGKPAELSPLVCARYGWENCDTDMLQCGACKAFVCGKLPPRWDKEAYEKSLEKLKKVVISSHDRLCVLNGYPCPEEFCNVQVDSLASLSTSFTERASALSEIQDHLPILDLSRLEEHGYDAGQAGAYCKRLLMPLADISPQVVSLAFSGWTRSPGSKNVLMCLMCRRRVGLWNFTHSQDSSRAGDCGTEEEPVTKRRRISVSSDLHNNKLEPVSEHHHWCPWVQTLTLRSKSSKAASPTACVTPPRRPGVVQERERNPSAPGVKVPVFIAALKSVAPGLMDNNTGLATGMKKSPMTEGMRCFRREMNTWSSPTPKPQSNTHSPLSIKTQKVDNS